MWLLVASLRVVDALAAHHYHDAGELLAAILAGAIFSPIFCVMVQRYMLNVPNLGRTFLEFTMLL